MNLPQHVIVTLLEHLLLMNVLWMVECVPASQVLVGDSATDVSLHSTTLVVMDALVNKTLL